MSYCIVATVAFFMQLLECKVFLTSNGMIRGGDLGSQDRGKYLNTTVFVDPAPETHRITVCY